MNTEDHFITSDGLSLERHDYFIEDNPKHIILIVHGHGEHAGRYPGWIERLNAIDLNVSVFSHRGHGKSDGKKGHAPSMNQLLMDVEYFIRSVRVDHLDARLYLYGHSMGGNIALNYLLRDKSKEIYSGIITSPWIKLAFQPSSFQLTLAKTAAKLFPSLTQHSNLDAREISTIQAEVEKYKADPLVHDLISAKLFTELTTYGKKLLSRASELKHPILLAHGKLDKVTSFEASMNLSEDNDQITFKAFPESKHEIHHDAESEDLLNAIQTWFLSVQA